MSVRRPPLVADELLDVRQRLTLFKNTTLASEAALRMAEGDITYDVLLRHGVQAVNVQAAGLRPSALRRMGCTSARQLRRLGFDALHLVDPAVCTDANAVYGAAEVVEAFLCTPQDAVALAGSDAVATLDLSVDQLLQVCAGAPTEAHAVLQQCQQKNPLAGVQAKTLLDTGLRATQLRALGFNLASLRELSGWSSHDITKLGFSV